MYVSSQQLDLLQTHEMLAKWYIHLFIVQDLCFRIGSLLWME